MNKRVKRAVIVTGHAGFIGINLTKRLIREGYIVVGVDDFSNRSSSRVTALERVDLIAHDKLYEMQFDINRLDFVQIALERLPRWLQFEYVFHLASLASPVQYRKEPLHTLWTNAGGLKNALDLAKHLGARLIYTSSSEVYGDPEIHPQPESYPGNANFMAERACYTEAKKFGEVLIRCYNDQFRTDHGVVRLFNAYGPFMSPDDGRVISTFLRQALQGEPLTVHRGDQTRSFCYVDDTVQGLLVYAGSSAIDPVNIGSDHEIKIKDLAMMIKEKFNSSLKIEWLDQPDYADPSRRRPLLTELRRMGWELSVNLENGLEKTYHWMASFYDVHTDANSHMTKVLSFIDR